MENNSAEGTTRLKEQLQEIVELAGGLAHEIRNPLSTISLNLGVLSEELADTETPRDRRMRERIGVMQSECRRLESFLNDFLKYVRVNEVEPEPTELAPYLLDFISFVRPDCEKLGIEISPHLAADLPNVAIDRMAFRRALLNLTRNAQEAMSDGGVIDLQAFQRDDSVIVQMIDTGAGMSAETQERIFETFYSTRDEGSGLGLPTVRRIIQAHGGEILCSSELGKGTRFTISLPRV